MAHIIDGRDIPVREINERLKNAAKEDKDIILKNPGAKHNISVGLTGKVNLTIEGSVGYFGAGLINGPKVTICGNAGWFAADAMKEAEVIIEGNAGTGAG